ncbi:nucleotidyltransferase domain-containing protein [Paenibacillus nasutitermitis]|uniref:Aminoglycoside-2''-adenylyltransferase n=1 Tax=Paenibacillus nasutitermitis TaxID=1652958 RepID=A0A917E156_9BACL|nr:hypothetical protein [Paenibacillus nasutitermitis]GGD93792.1 hypothetical protein GCM10010911_60560 [Paenibacillus nasutitermitis]
MRTDIYNWVPITVSEVSGIFSDIPVKWGIGGGWALDLYLGKQSRAHADIDVILFREEQLTAFAYLSKDWILYKAENGKLTLWNEGEFLASTNDIWVCRDDESPWAFQIMFVDTEHDFWIYKREKSIRREVKDIFTETGGGTPYLKPEIQLLYKGGSAEIREKDQKDFLKVWPSLLPQAKEWLKSSLNIQFPNGHPWADSIENKNF